MAKKSFLGLFTVEDSKPASEKPKVTSTESGPSTTPSVKPATLESYQTDEGTKKFLAGILDQANIPGFDYYEFAAAVEEQKIHSPAESVRFQSVFSTAKVMGVTVDKLIESADTYLAILEKEREKFFEAEKQTLKDQITSKESDLSKIDEDIKDLSQKIQELTEQINALQESRVSTSNEIGESKIRIEQTKMSFLATLDFFIKRIEADREKIKKYLVKKEA